MSTYAGRCYCGTVQFQVSGQAAAPHLCNCHDCRHSHATEASHQVVYGEKDFKVTAGQDSIAEYGAPKSIRYFCKKCGTRTHRSVPGIKSIVVFPSNFDICNGEDKQSGGVLPNEWKPTSHLFYGSRYKGHEYDDGLPYVKDAPKEMGGSGEILDWKGNPKK